ncbi:MAG TPA: hypothetical protein VMT52_20475 [Planctomycetota bacterium]|nr:hypothetical protein [Planctomycetota bacterium]
MPDSRGLLSAPASRGRTYERKGRRSRRALSREARSPLRLFFTGGVEYDDGLDPRSLETFFRDFRAFLDRFEVPAEWGQEVELKFRRLGRHRAEGLYYPEQAVLVLDVASSRSFAHEFGHLLDYGGAAWGPARPGAAFSSGDAFRPFADLMVARMRAHRACDSRFAERGGRVSWGYFTSRTECFARAFEQCVAEVLPDPCAIAKERERYRADPLFFDAVPADLEPYFREVLRRQRTRSLTVATSASRTTP